MSQLTPGPTKLPSTEQPRLTLTDLPTEIIFEIFEYFEPVFLHKVVSRICKKFNEMLHYEFLWKQYYHDSNGLAYPHICTYPYLEKMGLYSEKWRSAQDMSWRALCVSTENAKSRWFDLQKTVDFRFPDTTVNVVHVMKEGYCLAGSRERTIQIMNIPEKKTIHHVSLAHTGWLSGLSTMDDTVVSSGWDSFVKIWSLRDNMQQLNAFCLDMAVMALACQPRMIAACTFPELAIIDPRIGRSDGYNRYAMEEGSVVQLSFWNNYVILASRSKALMQFDLRMGKTCVRESIPTVSTPRTMSILDDIVYVGDNAGKVYMFDPYKNFNLIDMFKVCKKQVQIRALIPRRGYFIVGSSDGELKTVLSVVDRRGIKVLNRHFFDGEVSYGHCNDNMLAILANGSMGVVTIFYP